MSVSPPLPDPDMEDSQPANYRRIRHRRVYSLDPAGVPLFCGAEQPPADSDFDVHRPHRIQILPGEDDYQMPPDQPYIPRSNGCGTRVHKSATAKHRYKSWMGAYDDRTDVVIPLDSQYVPSHLEKVIYARHEHCGCLRTPVGCAVCGNPLGASLVLCDTHLRLGAPKASSLCEFVPSAVSPPLPPEPPSVPSLSVDEAFDRMSQGLFRS
ncbi:hypothetical protein C8R43DRAFT_974551 [Mycena crocata]|nr:hypothetical protein C8R43DRAFT_974551 [Mycena crocata]